MQNSMSNEELLEKEAIMLEFEKKIKDEKKKNNGIFYTDFKMADLMYDNIKGYIDKDKVVVDPCCGAGVFVLSGLKNGYVNVFGLDNDIKAVKLCNDKLGLNNIYNSDTLSKNLKLVLKRRKIKNPDLIIGNPPYVPMYSGVTLYGDDEFINKVDSNGNNLFIVAILRAMECISYAGVISYIIPKNFLHVRAYNSLRKEILMNYKIISIVDIGAYFKNVRGEQIILTLKNELTSDAHMIIFKKYVDFKFIELTSIKQNYFNNEILLFSSTKDVQLYEKLTYNYKLLKDVAKYIKRGRAKGDNAISGKNLIKFGFKDINCEVPKCGNKIFIQNIYSAEAGIIGAFGGELEAKETVTVITYNNMIKCKYLLGILHSRLCNYYLIRYCFNNSRLTLHTDIRYIEMIPIVIYEESEEFHKLIGIVEKLENELYLSENWMVLYEELNKLIYQLYEIDDDEIVYIENYLKTIHSKRWFL